MTSTPAYQPIPPGVLPPARTVTVPGRGELFLRDTDPAASADRPTVLLLHGWFATADLNWHASYDALVGAGYRVLALDHRGHGRGLRSAAPFRLSDCAADAAGLLDVLGVDPVLAVGYSMGGAIAQLMARDHRDRLRGIVLSGTRQDFEGGARIWRLMGPARLAIALGPRRFYEAGFRRNGLGPGDNTAWTLGEMLRHDPRAVAEAGRELGRFDSRPWLSAVDVPAAMVLTARDSAVPPWAQRALAEATAISTERIHEVALDHLQLTRRPEVYNPALLAALADLG